MSGERGRVRARVVRPGELSAREIEVWRELRARSGVPANPFMEPEFTLAVGRARARTARVAVLRGDGEEPLGFLPYERTRFGGARAIGYGVSDCQGAVLRPGSGLSARELLRGCGIFAFEFDNLEDGQGALSEGVVESFSSPVIDVSGGYAAYEAWLRRHSPKFLRTTLAKERKLGRESGDGLRFVFDERDPAALRTLMGWKSAQYRRTGRRDRFAQEWISRLVRDLHQAAPGGRSGVLSVLYAGERPVAAHFGLRSRTVLSCWFPAYDPDFRRYSPGLVLHLRMAEAAAREGIGLLDLGRGDAEYKDSLRTGALAVHEGACVRPGVRSGVRWIGREPVRRAHSFVRNRRALAGHARRVLNHVGRFRGGTQG
ncbi:GNAT family N-acetyltransferase [Streptomyces sp. MUM 203J]|uniref:GNAT family N-acetyltransferase n=1 Tax=Streptomyces sp. MUM 203J TaxID=2791990 RepID=UPI001F0393F1|nr:GNAT family N-acetyltransferase [Streptomyces sp. MUM 203J]MCH0538400.1 GNAT family N-acetyltransferase [Streptomyces sp. MUM 203J]